MVHASHFTVAGLQIDLGRADNTEAICNEILLTKRVFPFVDMMLLAGAVRGSDRT